MLPRQDQISRIITRLALIVGLMVAASLPLLDFLTSFSDLSEALEFKAKIKASALDSLIATNPDLWVYAENRMQGLISREPVPLDDEQVRVFDGQGALIIESGTVPKRPALSKSYPLLDASRVVGRLEVSGSLRGVVYEMLVAAVLGQILGALVFACLRILPLRALRRVTNELREEKERAETTLQSISDAVITTDANGLVQYINPTGERLLGATLEAIRERAVVHVVLLIDGTTRERVENSLYQALAERRVVTCNGNSELCRSDSTTIAVEEHSAPIVDQHGRVTGGVMVLRDVSVAREYIQRRSWEATHDLLTGLVNRREFENRVRIALANMPAPGQCYIICYMDLDRFKVVNDTGGHGAGDELLIQISRLMQARIRDTDTLARLGGDEFGLLLEHCDVPRGQLIATDILVAVNEFHFAWEAKVHTVGVSIGLTAMSANHTNIADVFGEADCACYWAKEQGRNRVCVYRPSDMDLAARRSETGWVSRITAAFEQKRFVLYHQTYRRLNGSPDSHEHLEVLLRMIDETGAVIAPGCFLPAAERYNLVSDIDRWVIHAVCSQYHMLVAKRGGTPLTCAINLSGASFNTDGFLDYIKAEVRQYHLSPGSICFELTETVAVNNLAAAADFMLECKKIGIQFALDDFGSGTSSFRYLKMLPIDYLKIDGSFVRNIEHDSLDLMITESISRMAHFMGKLVVAEYAENETIVEILGTIGVDFAQGFGICLPEPLFEAVSPRASVGNHRQDGLLERESH